MRAALVGTVVALMLSCGKHDDTAPLPSIPCDSTARPELEAFALADVAVHLESGGDANLELVRADLKSTLSKLWSGPVDVASSAPDSSKRATVWISASDAAKAKLGRPIDAGYALARLEGPKGPIFLVTAADATNLAYGAYAFLETLGVRFFHPKQDYVPVASGPRLPRSLSIARRAWVEERGIQPHTLHPIEWMAPLNQASPENLADAKRLIDWLAKTGQNHLQWPLLGSVPFDAFRAHATAIVEYAHTRHVTVGAAAQTWAGSSLQANYILLKDQTKGVDSMDPQVDQLMTIPWDAVDLQLGEFVSADPNVVLEWLNHALARVIADRPGTKVNVHNHVGNYPKLWITWEGKPLFFYHLPQFADERLGQTVHTLAFFDLYRDWATYKHPDFHLQHDYLLAQLPRRRVRYEPESAYWIGADSDVPLFLPEYLQARWNDIHGLAAEIADKKLPAMQGHVNFSSGHEWLYWLTDYLTAKMLWDPGADLKTFLADYGAAFGSCSGPVTESLAKLVELQNRYLFDQRLMAYLQGENVTIDFAFAAGYETHPKRVEFEEVLKMPPADRATFESKIVAPLEAMASEMQPIEDAIAARCRGADAAIAPWCDELRDGVQITRLRAEHAVHLYRSILAKAAGGDAEAQYQAALTVTEQASKVVGGREKAYRFDPSRLDDAYENPTVYKYGYLRTVHTLCYYRRREEQVRNLLDEGVPLGIAYLPTCQD